MEYKKFSNNAEIEIWEERDGTIIIVKEDSRRFVRDEGHDSDGNNVFSDLYTDKNLLKKAILESVNDELESCDYEYKEGKSNGQRVMIL